MKVKYIAIFDLPEGYKMGCAVGKMINPDGKEIYHEEDFENVYAQIEPLSELKEDIFERYNIVTRIIQDLGLSNAYDMPGFWCNHGKDYKVIQTKYHRGYMQALEDVEKAIRQKFGFAERNNVAEYPFDFGELCGADMREGQE